MPMLVTHNLRTELDIMNSTQGFITNIILHPAEPLPSQTKPTVELHHLPLFILVKLNQTHTPHFGSEDEAVIPISPIQMSIRLHLSQNSKNVVQTITQKQFPTTAAYALTDYHAHGQTIPAVIIDLAPPPMGKLSLFNLYVALLRSSGQDTIHLLQDFNEKSLTSAHLLELSSEDDQLRCLNDTTQSWWKTLTKVHPTKCFHHALHP